MANLSHLRNLAIEAQKGQADAYRQLLERLYPYLTGLIRKKLGGLADAEDLTQECLLAIHRNLHTYNPEKDIQPWIAAIARYKIADYFRAVSKRNEELFEENRIPVTNPPSEANFDVGECLTALPEPLRRLIVMTKIEGVSYEDAAKKEGISEVALRKRISRAYVELKKLILEQQEGETAFER